MTKFFRNALMSWRAFFRTILYPSSFLALIGVGLAVYDPLSQRSVTVDYFLLLCVSFVFLIVLSEAIFRKADASSRFFKNQDSALRALGDLSKKIENARIVHLLGTTFKSFSDNEENLRALQAAISKGADVRILMMDPSDEQVASLLASRKDRNEDMSAEVLRNEITNSVSRIRNTIGDSACSDRVRFYKATRSISIYHIGDEFLVTCYTHGRGGSSPVVLYSTDDISKDEFAFALARGIDELWEAKSTTRYKA